MKYILGVLTALVVAVSIQTQYYPLMGLAVLLFFGTLDVIINRFK